MWETSSSARPIAFMSRAALSAAASAAVAAGGDVADLRRDAWGHGILAVAQAVTAAGARAVRVDSDREIEVLALEGITAVSDVEPDMDAHLLYGLPDQQGVLRTQPLIRLTGTVLSTKRLRAGDAVSYGYTHRAAKDTEVALVTGGYAQGIMRALGNRAHVEVGGLVRPIIGRVAMDVCVVDLEGVPATEGTEMTYFGGSGPAGPALARWATLTGLTVAELSTVVVAHAERRWEA